MSVSALRRMAPTLLASAALGLAACGDDSDSNADQAGAAATGSAGQERAEKVIAPLVGKPSPFPATTPLQRDPAGKSLVYVNCGTPACGLFSQFVAQAAKTAGMDLVEIKGGTSPQAVNEAMSTVLERAPDAVIVPGVDPRVYAANLKKIKAAGIAVVSFGTVGGKALGIDVEIIGEQFFTTVARQQAAWVHAKKGDDADVVFFYSPEFSFGKLSADAFSRELTSLCAACKVRAETIPVAQIGSKAPQTMVSDLQRRPDTNVVVVPTSEMLGGLPAALKTAGLEPTTVGAGGSPQNMQYVRDGQQTADLAADFPVMSWMAVDAAARLTNDEPVPDEIAAGVPDLQWLEKDDITFDVRAPWVGYPDYTKRFAKLWSAK